MFGDDVRDLTVFNFGENAGIVVWNKSVRASLYASIVVDVKSLLT